MADQSVNITAWPNASLTHTFDEKSTASVSLSSGEKPVAISLSPTNVALAGDPQRPVAISVGPTSVSLSSGEKPVGIALSPASVSINTNPDQPAHVSMAMSLSATAPIGIRIAEPIVAVSQYTISIDFMDRPLASITLKGQTTLGTAPQSTPPQ